MNILKIIKKGRLSELNEGQKKLLAKYEVALTTIEFLGGLTFIIGSVLFFNEQTVTLGTWFFLVGSFFFVCKPTLKWVKEIHIYRCGKYEYLDKQLKDQ